MQNPLEETAPTEETSQDQVPAVENPSIEGDAPTEGNPPPEGDIPAEAGDQAPGTHPHAEPIVYMQWVTTAYRQTEKGKAWYAIMGLVVMVFVIYGLLSDAYGWIVSLTFLLLAGVYYMTELKRAPVVQVSISDHGVRFGSRYFPYGQLKSFWIISDEGIRNLHLSTYKGAQREVSIMLAENINIAKLRDFLLAQIPEEEGKKESFSDHLIRNIGL